mgnify:FL=1
METDKSEKRRPRTTPDQMALGDLAAHDVQDQRIEELEAKVAELGAELETAPGERPYFVMPRNAETYWKEAFGGPYRPVANGRHKAAHPLVIKEILAGERDARTDAIAALTVDLLRNLERERTLLEAAAKRERELRARVALLEKIVDEEGLVVDGDPGPADAPGAISPVSVHVAPAPAFGPS